MNRKPALLKKSIALAASLFAVLTWAADGGALFCVKAQVEDDFATVFLSQQDASYSPESGEDCSEFWYSVDGNPSAYSFIERAFSGDDLQDGALYLTSNIDFGGYNESTEACVNEFKPVPGIKNGEQVTMTSYPQMGVVGNYVIRGVCYINSNGGARFADESIAKIANVIFEDLRLESSVYAGILSTEDPDASGGLDNAMFENVSVINAVIKAPVAGVLAAAVPEIHINSIEIDNVTIYSTMDGVTPPSDFAIGGLVGSTAQLFAANVYANELMLVHNPPETGTAAVSGKASMGGVVGNVSYIELKNVGLNQLVITNQSTQSGNVGGLIGTMEELSSLHVYSTYTRGDISCTRSSDCYMGYGLGFLRLDDEPDSYSIKIVSNYHYSESDSDTAKYFVGNVFGHYVNSMNGSHTYTPDLTEQLGLYGTLPYYDYDIDDVATFAAAAANFRNATGSVSATSGFDSGSYSFTGGAQGDFSNGVIDGEYMRSAEFSKALNRYASNNSTGAASWSYDETMELPALKSSGSENSGQAGDVFVMFYLSCLTYTDCLTEDELEKLKKFENAQTNEFYYQFEVDENGNIVNQDWEDFAVSLTKKNPDRGQLRWVGTSQTFAAGNVYTSFQYYSLTEVGDAGEDDPGDGDEEDLTEDTAYVFFGEGIDYYSTPVRLISFDGTSVKNKGNEIDRAEFTGGDAPLRMLPGKVMRIVANDPATTDGSKFKGWVVHAGFANANEGESALRYKAFAGIDVPVDSDGYFDMNGLADTAQALYEKEYMGSANVAEVTAELQKLRQEMMELIQSGKYDDKEAERLSAKADSLEEVMNGTESPDIVVVLAIFPKGFESQNEAREIVEAPDGPDSPELELAAGKSALLQSGNSVQFNVNTNKFVYDGEQPYVNFVVEDADGNKIDSARIEYESGDWPDVVQWDRSALRPGLYYATAEVFDGAKLKTRQWNFEVKGEIASDCENCWYMVSLANVDFKKFKWNSTEIFYWWNESVLVGKYWQYEEVERKSKIDDTRGYWYNSVLDKPLVLKDSADVNNGEKAVWEVDSVHTGWNMVRNPYGWSVNVSHLERSGLSFFRWVPERGSYDSVAYVRPYESIWVKAPHRMSIVLPSTPAYIDSVDADGNAVPLASLQKSHALAKASGVDDWAVQVSLADANGKADTWNVLGVAAKSRRIEEPPAGMGDYVNLSILEGKTRLAKSVQTANAENAYEWRVELSASRDRRGYLQFKGVESLAQYGLHLYVTVDGETTEITDGEKFAVPLTTSAKIAEVRIAKAAKKVVAYTLQGLRVSQNAGALQVAFDASAGLAGASSRIDVVDVKGKVAATARFNAVDGRNAVEIAKPRAGLYVVRVVAGSQVAVQKVLVR